MTLFAALDTATDVGSVAVGPAGAPAAEVIIGRRRHAADLIPAMEEALRLSGASWADLAGIIVGDGPGSFTGLRIAFATVLGVLRQRPNLPLFTAPSLVSTARLGAQLASGPVAALYDALRGEVYVAVCDFSKDAPVIVPPRLTTVDALAAEGVVAALAIGDGAAAYAEQVHRWTGRPGVVPPAGAPRASTLIELIETGIATRVSDPSAWEPAYGRPAEAQVRWERKHGRALPGATGS